MTLKKSIWKKLGLLALVVAVTFTFAACDNGSVTDEVSEYDVNFTVKNESGDAIADATIEMDGKTETTTDKGTAQFTVKDGEYDYTVTAENYQEKTGKVTVNGEVENKPVELTAKGDGETPEKDLTIESVSAINEKEFEVTFGSAVDAVDASNFEVSNATVDSAVLSEDGTVATVTLKNYIPKNSSVYITGLTGTGTALFLVVY